MNFLEGFASKGRTPFVLVIILPTYLKWLALDSTSCCSREKVYAKSYSIVLPNPEIYSRFHGN